MLNSFFVLLLFAFPSIFSSVPFISLFPNSLRSALDSFFVFLGFQEISADVSLIFPRHIIPATNMKTNEFRIERAAKHFSNDWSFLFGYFILGRVRFATKTDPTAYRMGSFVVKRSTTMVLVNGIHRQFPFCTHFPPFKFSN